MILFEKVLYLREIEPCMELSWTLWITEEVKAGGTPSLKW